MSEGSSTSEVGKLAEYIYDVNLASMMSSAICSSEYRFAVDIVVMSVNRLELHCRQRFTPPK